MSRQSYFVARGSLRQRHDLFFINLGLVFLCILGAFTTSVSSRSSRERRQSFARQSHGASSLGAPDENGRQYKNLRVRQTMNSDITRNMADFLTGGIKFLGDSGEFVFQEPSHTTPRTRTSVKFDFIVIGGGTAGAAIAARLSEIRKVTVLLIEAGGDENIIMGIPVIANFLQLSKQLNWGYLTERSDTYCLGMQNHQCKWPRGRVLGGSSVLNHMVATRGNKKDYDRWAQLGNYGWSWNEVLPYFKKLETMAIPEFRNDTRYHNGNGPVNVDYVPYRNPLAKAFVQAGIEMGWANVDYNGEKQSGFSHIQATIKGGMRFSSNRAYIQPSRKRSNLRIMERSLVTKILMDENEKRAIGVEFIKMNQTYRVFARKEVILSAGSIGSPQLLMLSGIGPARHLKEMGIKIMVDAPVGENLMDHIAYGGLVFFDNQSVGLRFADLLNPRYPHLRDFLLYRTGPITTPGGVEAIAFVNVDDNRDPSDHPNVELFFVPASIGTMPILRECVGLDEDFWRKTFSDIDAKYSWTIFPMLMRPKSRGKILLRSPDVHSKPRIIANYMNDPDDVRVLIKGIRLAIQVAKTRAMQEFGSKLHQTPMSGCEGFPNDSDEYWECSVRSFPMNIYHYCGTCKMAPEGDPTAVVNPRLQVIGVRGLRVADASIMPEIPTGHTNIPTYMIAEKLADMVKQDWGYPTDPLA